jgi:putative ABC transport system permease protein
VVALLLAVVGLYGVMSYTVSQRREELGLRAAVGASAADLVRLVMMDGVHMTLVGTAIGLLLALGLSGLMASQLYEVRGVDAGVYAGMTVLLLLVAATACGIPAIRAARTDPTSVLKSM